jgi:hypothetical protein
MGILIGQAFTDLTGESFGHVYLLCNASSSAVGFNLPAPVMHLQWHLVFDTVADLAFDDASPVVDSYLVQPHAMVMITDGIAERRSSHRELGVNNGA